MSRRLKMPKDYRPLVEEALAKGWTLSYEGKHPKLTAPDGYATPIPTTSGARQMWLAFRNRLVKHPSWTEDSRA